MVKARIIMFKSLPSYQAVTVFAVKVSNKLVRIYWDGLYCTLYMLFVLMAAKELIPYIMCMDIMNVCTPI